MMWLLALAAFLGSYALADRPPSHLQAAAAQRESLVTDLLAAMDPQAMVDSPQVRADLLRLSKDVQAAQAQRQRSLAVTPEGHAVEGANVKKRHTKRHAKVQHHRWGAASSLLEVAAAAGGAALLEQHGQPGEPAPPVAAAAVAGAAAVGHPATSPEILPAPPSEAAQEPPPPAGGTQSSLAEGLGGQATNTKSLGELDVGVASTEAAGDPLKDLLSGKQTEETHVVLEQAVNEIAHAGLEAAKYANAAAESFKQYGNALKQLKGPLEKMTDSASDLHNSYVQLMEEEERQRLMPFRTLLGDEVEAQPAPEASLAQGAREG